MKKKTNAYLFFACIILYVFFLLTLSLTATSGGGSSKTSVSTNTNTREYNKTNTNKSTSGIHYKSIQNVEELVSFIDNSPSTGEANLIIVGLNGNYCVNGIDTGISSQTNLNSYGEKGAYVLFIENVSETDKELIYSILYSNQKVKTFSVDKKTGAIDTEYKLDIYIGENGNWFINDKDTCIKANVSQYEDYINQTHSTLSKEEWLELISNGNINLEYRKQYTCVYYPENGDYPYSVKYYENSNFINMGEPEKEGYTFIGWLNEDNKLMEYGKDIINSNIELYAIYKHNDYKLTLKYDNGENNEFIFTHYGESLFINNPTRENFEFLGWYYDDKLIDLSSYCMNCDATCVAKWRPLYTLNKANSDSKLCNSLLTIKGACSFDGWYCDDMLALFPENQVFRPTITSMDDLNRASSNSLVINNETKLDIVGETKSKKTAMIQELDYESEPRYYVRT